MRWLSAVAVLGLLAAAVYFSAGAGPSAVGGQPGSNQIPAHAPEPSHAEAASFRREPESPRTKPTVPSVMATVPFVSEWERVERHCPWPPTTPDSWTEISGECDAAMMELSHYPVWRSSLRDAVETRRAAVAALDDAQCRVPPGEIRPTLYEACEAEALIRLAEMQHGCVNVLARDWDSWEKRARTAQLDKETGQILGPPRNQEEYYRRIELTSRRVAFRLWERYLCAQVPPGILDWIDVLPVPEVNPERRPFAPVPTQAPELLEIARRLGATSIPALDR
ncbi:MAG: hypothetical protein OXH68_14680 [Gammaproteobacteria bacterium]|nr:hypothetical protein [Gammaproteobacteria bacterium]